MTDLVDEVKASFEHTKEEHGDNRGPISVITSDMELAPAFGAMREYYEVRLLAITRRCYRFFAGGTLPRESDRLLAVTGEQMMTPLIATLLRAFTDGVMIGQQSDHLVKMCLHFNQPEHLFHDEEFIHTSAAMASGFADDEEVKEYFLDYALGGLSHLSHVCGFAHQEEVDPAKVWDIWLMAGTACVCSSYLAGNKLGTAWRERDVLDGIAIATEELPSGSEGEGSSDH